VSILYILLVLIVAGLLLWAVNAILNAPGITLADPFRTILRVVIILLVCLFVLQCFFGILPGVPRLTL
jgi:hypothetical protein